MIAFEQVTKCYASGQEALSEVSFSIKTGEMAFVTGHSGAGKSTLLKLMMLIERPTKGHILINDVAVDGFSHRQIPLLRRKFGIVHQNHQLLSDRSVFDNVALPLIIAGFAPRDVGRRVRAALDKVNLLSKEKQLPEMLSGGEQQRVGIARAVVNKPPFLIADEPTGNLDPELSTQIMQIFQDFNDVGVTVLVATHDLALLARMPHRSLTLREGKLIGSGLPSSSMHHSSAQPHDAHQPSVQVDI